MDLLFRTDEAVLADSTGIRLQELATTLATMPDIHLQLDGFADERGDESYNQDLSRQRVEFVRPSLDGSEPSWITCDLASILERGEGAHVPMVQARDIVYVRPRADALVRGEEATTLGGSLGYSWKTVDDSGAAVRFVFDLAEDGSVLVGDETVYSPVSHASVLTGLAEPGLDEAVAE